VYFSHGEFIELYTSRLVDCNEINEIISRLELITHGCMVRLRPLLVVVVVRAATALVVVLVVVVDVGVDTSDCNSNIPKPAIFSNPESQD